MVFSRKLGNLFNKVSSTYHSSRKGYPNKVFLNIIKISKINKKSKILDIGCGSGLSTLPISEKGYLITGIDRSKELIKIAKKSSKNNNPKYLIAKFEDYKFKKDFYDLIISGQAFHWFDEKIAYKKCFKILKNNSYLAIFAKFNDYKRSNFLNKLRKIFISHCKYYPLDLHQDDYIKNYLDEIKRTKLFKGLASKKSSYYINYTLKDYRDYILSNSWIIKLTDSKRKKVMQLIDNLLISYKWPMKIPFGIALITSKVNKVT